jgi:hypothetical protein
MPTAVTNLSLVWTEEELLEETDYEDGGVTLNEPGAD